MADQPIASTSEERQIAIRLSTKDANYTIPPAKFLVPASWRRYQLSELINKVLENDSPIPFDFLIDQTLLRTSLGTYCQQTNTSEEIVLDVEFLPSTLPPQLDSTVPAEDWVSDVQIERNVPGAILSASYAGTLSFQQSGISSTPLTFSGHDLSVLSTCYIHQSIDGNAPRKLVASGGMDRIARVWEYETPSLSLTDLEPSSSIAPKTLYTLSLHQAPISSVRSRSPLSSPTTSSSSAPHLLTAGWDGLIGVWDLGKGVNEETLGDSGFERTKKKRRKSTSIESVKNKTPMSVLRGHTNKVSRALFDRNDASVAYSAGWDHTVRIWDLEHGIEKESKVSDKVHLSLAQLATPSLLLTGSTDRLLSLFDLRTSSLSSISLSLSGHTGPVSSVAEHPTNGLMFVSGSYDSTIKVWDARSPKQALFSLDMPQKEGKGEREEKDKVLCVAWDGERIVAGGEGAKVAVWRVSGKEGEAEGEKMTVE
ncbi:Ytm1p [Sporobolomyces salmoneus]|uniref:Ytm1p n=1 Tax=Sporobolomyces salmoneus TaxID=183962 RepID=UPI00317EC601